MKIILIIVIYICLIHPWIFKKYKNPYKLYMIFGKKGSGKSSYLCKLAKQYQKRGYYVYTNMPDCVIPNIRIIDPDDLGDFIPEEKSVILLDECGMLYDNRQYKSFKNSVRDFFVLQRHYKCIVYLCSQSYNVDKKLRDLCDEMYLIQNIGIVYGLVRPIRKTITLTEATSEGESRIAENLKFRFITSWKLFYIPKQVKNFQSYIAPEKPALQYKNPDIYDDIEKERKFHIKGFINKKLRNLSKSKS